MRVEEAPKKQHTHNDENDLMIAVLSSEFPQQHQRKSSRFFVWF